MTPLLAADDVWYNATNDGRSDLSPFMGTPASALDRLNKVVVGYLDRRRVKGYAYDFSALKESFNLLPPEDPFQGRGTKVEIKDLKAIFFVKDFTGKLLFQESLLTEAPKHGRKIEVAFHDGEKIAGRTEGFNPQKLGFFVFPDDPMSNNTRIFVVTKNAHQVRFI